MDYFLLWQTFIIKVLTSIYYTHKHIFVKSIKNRGDLSAAAVFRTKLFLCFNDKREPEVAEERLGRRSSISTSYPLALVIPICLL